MHNGEEKTAGYGPSWRDAVVVSSDGELVDEIPCLHLCSVSVSLSCCYHDICYGSFFFLSLRKADIIIDGISGLHLCFACCFHCFIFSFGFFFTLL